MLKQLSLHFVEYQYQQPLCEIVTSYSNAVSQNEEEYSISKAYIHAATKQRKQWSSNFIHKLC